MAKKTHPSKQASEKPGQKSAAKKASAGKPLAILAIAVVAALGVAFLLSGGETQTTATPVNVPELTDYAGGGQVRGAENPAVTLVEYGDYECPSCAYFHPITTELLERMPDTLEFEFHHYPLTMHPNAFAASIAAESAGEQGRYWEMHDTLFETQNQWAGRENAQELFTSLAGQLGLDTDRFTQDFGSEEIRNRVIADVMRGNGLQISGTPTFFINGQRLVNLPQTADEFEAIIQSVLGR